MGWGWGGGRLHSSHNNYVHCRRSHHACAAVRRITANRVYDVKNASLRVYHCVLDSRSGACGNTVYVTRTFVLSVFSFVTDKNNDNTHNSGKRCKHAAVKLILLSISIVFVAAVLICLY